MPNKTAKTKPSYIRIIGGKWRSRKLPVPVINGLRPTGDRVRETLFNWLNPYIDGARVLDAFSGSGALAFEALSRGAQYAMLLDNSKQAIDNLKQSAILLDSQSTAEIRLNSALRFLQNESATEAFNIVFLDPPFEAQLLEDCITKLDNSNLLAPRALIYIEQNKRDPIPSPPHNWTLIKQKQSGEVCSLLFQIDE